ncbi:TatD family deoxyribonuclease [Mesorhizobium sp. B4-1-3]|uniref:Qat anti-phage system TatD family nuclease QatD n=1 Tax=Mesorhizobium sp. B4-1-3 TaxID=2589889 RepID=UPI00112A8711|nr:Qat anti-phage system TatD family nuclease QatD [Mesorhizobium sp. B4-1-3]TPI13063.1 TatD family deoxyribonuclease [Mesorhizobium sp. B4-1-3]
MTSFSPRSVDFHCHLDLYPDLQKAVSACETAKVATLAVTTTPKAFRRNQEVARNGHYVRVALGLHPQLAAERMSEVPLFEALLDQTRYVGEVGLDASPAYYAHFADQVRVFRRILTACAKQGDKVLSVHSVRAANPVLDYVEELLPQARGRVVLHWFSGTLSEARRALSLGCYFSVNERMFASPAGRRVIGMLPSDRVLTETDGPFIERDGTPISPGDVRKAVAELARTWGIQLDEAQAEIVRNLRALLSP